MKLVSRLKLRFSFLKNLQSLIQLAKQHEANNDAIKVIYSSLIMVSKIFYSLNCQVSSLYTKNNFRYQNHA